jgi:TonB family protein
MGEVNGSEFEPRIISYIRAVVLSAIVRTLSFCLCVLVFAACSDATGPGSSESVPQVGLPRPGVEVCYSNCGCGGTTSPTPPDSSTPTLDALPQLVNGSYISSLIMHGYPRELVGRVGGTTRIELIISETGDPESVWMCDSSGHAALDRLAVNVGTALKFIPGRYQGQDVRVLASMPITFIP